VLIYAKMRDLPGGTITASWIIAACVAVPELFAYLSNPWVLNLFAAGGGVIDKGQLFIANEAGPELVGTVGGKTTVTNQDQFTQGLIDANEMVVDAVMQVVRAVNNKSFDVYMDAQKVGKSVTTYQNNAARRYGV
jgi:hypothetical protein